LETQVMWDVVQIKTICLYFIASAQISLSFYISIKLNQNLPGEEPKNQYLTLIKFDSDYQISISAQHCCLPVYRGNSVMKLTLIRSVMQLRFLSYCHLLRTLQVVLIQCSVWR